MSVEVQTVSELPRWKRVLFTVITIVLAYALLDFAAAMYLRVERGYDGRHLYEFDFDPYKNIEPARNYVDTRGIHHNAQGFRRLTPVSRQKAPRTFRVFLMGGSTAYGTGGLWPHIQRNFAVIPDSQTIDHFLERELNDSFPGIRIEVINAAITSTWTHHHLIYLNQTILKYEPDMILFLDGFNDFYFYNTGHDQFDSYLYNSQAATILGEPTIGALAYANVWWLYRKSALAHVSLRAFRALKLTLAPKPTRRPLDTAVALAGLRRNFPENALKMHRRSGLILRDEGVAPVFMLQPMLILEREKHKPLAEQELFEFNVSSYLPNYESYAKQAVSFVAGQEANMARSIGAEFIDLTGIFHNESDQIYTDYAHLTPKGNRLLAHYVASRLVPLIAKKVRTHSTAIAHAG